MEDLKKSFLIRGNNIVGSGGSGEENTIESISVNGTPISIDEHKNVDITVPSIEGLTKDEDLATVAKSGSYNDLADKPTIPSLDGYAKTSEIPSKVSELENDSNYLSSIPEEYVTETELSAKGYLTEHQDISGKVDKVNGKSLIADTEIERLASIDNYNDTDIKAEIAKKADTTAIPSKVSELTNDSNYQTAEQVNSTVTTEIAKVVADAPEDFNTLKEMSDWITGHEDDASAMNSAILDNKTAIASLQTGKADKSEIPTVGNGTVTIRQAGIDKGTFTMNQTGNITIRLTDNDTTYSEATEDAAGLMSTEDKKKLDGITSGAEVNQNAFSNVIVGSTTISSDSKTDSLILAGSNVTITPDATNDKVTIGITKDNVTSALGYTPPTTNTWRGIQNNLTSDSTTDSLSAAQGKVLKGLVDGKAANSHTHTELMSKNNPTGTGSFSLNRKAGTTVGSYSHTEGYNNEASSDFSHAEGQNTTASGNSSHAEGANTTASGLCSHAEGSNFDPSGSVLSDRTVAISDVNYTISGSTAYGIDSHAEGAQSFAYGYASHAEGFNTIASNLTSHAEGNGTTSSGYASHAEGHWTTASEYASHAEGKGTTASGYASHAEGYRTTASGYASHAEGYRTTASNYASHVCGKHNVAMTAGGAESNTVGTAFVIGNGTWHDVLSNAFSVQYDGTVKAKSTITASTTADYAEFFEWIDKNPDEEDRVGHFVTLDGDKIKIATNEDDYILGIVSGEPFVLGNGDCDTWNGMFLHDEFRRTMYEPAPKIIEILDNEGNPTGEYEEVEGEYEGTRPILNPDYDPTQKYISRFDRAEWSPVGMLGVLAVLHDGTAEVNGYVTVNNEGIATKCTRDARNSYRVIKKVSDKVVEVIFR